MNSAHLPKTHNWTIESAVNSLTASRSWFLRHLEGIDEEAFAFHEPKIHRTIGEICDHLLENDRQAIQTLLKLDEIPPEIMGASYKERLVQSNEAVVLAFKERWSLDPSAGMALISGGTEGLERGISYPSVEDYYHSGQVTLLRLAMEQEWDYFAAIYS